MVSVTKRLLTECLLYRLFISVFRPPFKYRTIWQLHTNLPFEYQTCLVFGCHKIWHSNADQVRYLDRDLILFCRIPSFWKPAAGERAQRRTLTLLMRWTATEWWDAFATRKTPTSSGSGRTCFTNHIPNRWFRTGPLAYPSVLRYPTWRAQA